MKASFQIPDPDTMDIRVSIPPSAVEAEAKRREIVARFMRSDEPVERVIVHDNLGKPHVVTRSMIAAACDRLEDDARLTVHLAIISGLSHYKIADAYGLDHVNLVGQRIRHFWRALWIECGVIVIPHKEPARRADQEERAERRRQRQEERARKATEALRQFEEANHRAHALIPGDYRSRLRIAAFMRECAAKNAPDAHVWVMGHDDQLYKVTNRMIGQLLKACRLDAPRVRQVIEYRVFKSWPEKATEHITHITEEEQEADLTTFYRLLWQLAGAMPS